MNNHNQEVMVCNHCGYDTNPVTATNCLKCGQPLDVFPAKKVNKSTKPDSKLLGELLLTPWAIWLGFGLLFLLLSWLIFSFFGNFSSLNNRDDTRVVNSRGSNQNIPPDVKVYDSMKDVPNVPEGIFNYGAGDTLAALAAQGLHEAMTAAHPKYRLRFNPPKDNKPGGRKGVAMVIDGEITLTTNVAPLKDDDYQKAQQRGFKLKQVLVGMDAIIFFTHRDISIAGLSVEQLKDIYKGKLTNWKEVGGPDLPIVPIGRDPKAANLLNQLLEQEIDQLSPRVKFTSDTTETLRKVATTPGAISLGASATIIGQQTVRPLPITIDSSKGYVQPLIDKNQRLNSTAILDGSYPMSRRMFVLYRQDNTIEQLAGEAYINMLLTKEGQQIAEKAGLVPLR